VKVGYLSSNSISEPSFVTDLNLCAFHTHLKTRALALFCEMRLRR